MKKLPAGEENMGLVKEPLNVDFYFENRQMTEVDQKRVSAFIAEQKAKKHAAPKKRATKRKKSLV